jgi:hypothetical protein
VEGLMPQSSALNFCEGENNMEVDIRHTAAFAQTAPREIINIGAIEQRTAAHNRKLDELNPPAPELPENELGRLEEWKKQINQRLANGEKTVGNATEAVQALERRLKILTDERDAVRPRSLRPFEARKLATAILKVEDTLSLAKDFLVRMTRIADAAKEEAKTFPQERYNTLKREVLKSDNLHKALRGADSFNEIRFTP